MSLRPVAGMRIYIGPAAETKEVDWVEADFEDTSPTMWVEIGKWQQMGALGDAVTDIAEDFINTSRTEHQKGTASPRPMENVFGILPDDAGQLALIAAGSPSDKSNYMFRVKGNETTGFSSPSETYFVALVMGTPEQGGGANTIRKMTAQLQINSNLVQVPAVPV